MKAFVTGCCGFLGSHLVDRLLADGHDVVGFDNMSTGHYTRLDSPHYDLVLGNIANGPGVFNAMRGCDAVFHLAALADVRGSILHRTHHRDTNITGTAVVLDAAHMHDIKRFVFISSAAVYGEPTIFPTPEDAPMPIQTSYYGASKLAGEALCQAHAHAFGMQVYIYRPVSLLGERYTHGHVADFVKQLRDHPDHLDMLGDGTQRKSYLYVKDAVEGILCGLVNDDRLVHIYNLGSEFSFTVDESFRSITWLLNLVPHLNTTDAKRGWIGDSPIVLLDCARLRKLGWKPQVMPRDALTRTVNDLWNR